MSKTSFLREQAMQATHKKARIAMNPNWSTANLDISLSQRKALAIKMILDESPVYIGEQELIVGTRTIYQDIGGTDDKSYFSTRALPTYINETDIENFGGFNGEFHTKSHYSLDFSVILNESIDGMILRAKESAKRQTILLKQDYLHGIIIVYEALSNWIMRYSTLAKEMSLEEKDMIKKSELEKISSSCEWISHNKPRDFHEATQLYWFTYLATIIENFQWTNYGRVDQYLYPFYDKNKQEEIQQTVECFLLKMSDGVDIIDPSMGQYNAQINITLGGVTANSQNAVNELTFMFLEGLSKTRLAEPEVSCRIHSKNPPEFLEEASKLSVSGLNCMAYYNDDQFIKSMVAVGLKECDVNEYAFDLCQDITIPGKSDFYVVGEVDLSTLILKTLAEVNDTCDFEEFKKAYKLNIANDIKHNITNYVDDEKFIRDFANGNTDILEQKIKDKTLTYGKVAPFMSPLPFTSSLFEGTIEKGQDISWFSCPVESRGHMVSNLVVAINSLASLRKIVFDDKIFTLSQVKKACHENYENDEKMRQMLWNAPKWANDDDYVDLPAKEIIEFACDEIMNYKTTNGFPILAGIHQPHPVSGGWRLPATPEGRKAKTPITVTLSPENGTMYHGPTAAFKSACKIDPMKYQWNNCVMLQYFSSVFSGDNGYLLFTNLIKDYFSMGGAQHQPNVVNVEDLHDAQLYPEKYRDLIVRMWGVSAHFVNLPKELQDEFIARCENI